MEDGLQGVRLDQVRKEGLNQRRSTEQVRGWDCQDLETGQEEGLRREGAGDDGQDSYLV